MQRQTNGKLKAINLWCFDSSATHPTRTAYVLLVVVRLGIGMDGWHVLAKYFILNYIHDESQKASNEQKFIRHSVLGLLPFAAPYPTDHAEHANQKQQDARLGTEQGRGTVDADAAHRIDWQLAVVEETLDALNLVIGQRVPLARQNDGEHLVVGRGLAEGQHQVISHGLNHLHGAGELLIAVGVRHLLRAHRLPQTGGVILEAQQILHVGAPLVPVQPQVAGLLQVVSAAVVRIIAMVTVPGSVLFGGGDFVGYFAQVDNHTSVVDLLRVHAVLVGD